MKERHRTLVDPTGRELFVYVWEPEDAGICGIVQIVHGMAEHAGRYRHVAERLTEAGYAVYAADLRGHGRSGGKYPGDLGNDGFRWLTRNVKQVADEAMREQQEQRVRSKGANTNVIESFPADGKVILIGHSMGSFVAQLAAFEYPERYDALLLSGAAYKKGPLLAIGRRVAGLELALRRRDDRPSKLLHDMTFAGHNRAFQPARTNFDWLSRDPAAVERYIKDEKCGIVFTAAFYRELSKGLQELYHPALWRNMNRRKPILILAGALDPVGGAGKEVARLAEAYRAYGAERLEVKLYPDMRHEIFNELGCEQVLDDVMNWLAQLAVQQVMMQGDSL